jgi:capsular polysaccharide biosynthesis protein
MQLVHRIYKKYATSFPVNGSAVINGWISPESGIYYNQLFQPVLDSAFGKHKLARLVKRFGPLSKQIMPVACTISHGPWNNYYHWFIDILPRTWHLHKFHEEGQIDLIVFDLKEEYKVILETLLPPNVRIFNSSDKSWIRVKKAIFLPFISKDCCGSLPADYLRFFRNKAFSLFGIAAGDRTRKLYVSRKKADKRRILNEEALLEIVTANGFETVFLEDLHIAMQAGLFNKACCIVAPHGAGLTNLLFCEPGTRVMEIFGGAMGNHQHYKCLAGSLQLSYSYIECGAGTKNENYTIPEEQLRIIKDYCSA